MSARVYSSNDFMSNRTVPDTLAISASVCTFLFAIKSFVHNVDPPQTASDQDTRASAINGRKRLNCPSRLSPYGKLSFAKGKSPSALTSTAPDHPCPPPCRRSLLRPSDSSPPPGPFIGGRTAPICLVPLSTHSVQSLPHRDPRWPTIAAAIQKDPVMILMAQGPVPLLCGISSAFASMIVLLSGRASRASGSYMAPAAGLAIRWSHTARKFRGSARDAIFPSEADRRLAVVVHWWSSAVDQ